MPIDIPYFHADHPAYAEVYRDDAERLYDEKDRRENNAPPPPPATNNFSPQVATLIQSANLDISTALVGKIDFDNLPSTPKTVRQIPSSKPRRADQIQSRDHDALKKEAHRLALEIRRNKQHKLLIETGLVETNETTIEEIEDRIEECELRLREIAGASPIISAVVRKKALPLTEIAGEYAVIEKLLARKRILQEKFYQAQSDRQKRNLQKHIDRIDAELATTFAIITQNQKTAENGTGDKKPHERKKRFRKIGQLMAATRADLRLVSRKLMLLGAPKKADGLRQTLRSLSNEQESFARPRRMRLAQIKRENGRREEMRRHKACPEYWQDVDISEILERMELEENGTRDETSLWTSEDEEKIVRADDEAEMNAEANIETQVDELAAFYEQDDGDNRGWGTIYGGLAEIEPQAEA